MRGRCLAQAPELTSCVAHSPGVLRSRASSAYEKMWSELRDRRLGGLKFVREYPMGPFFADFVCRAEKVIVEIDGGTHSTEEEIADDEAREAYLRAQGFRIFRAHNGQSTRTSTASATRCWRSFVMRSTDHRMCPWLPLTLPSRHAGGMLSA